ncbi:TonB-dependent receptor [Gammaproteobacteria bacterium]|nr:TonB-dependent receptor [Gammaproteobacteria bacterium]MDA9842004.1 TonB-dependent receptor [Gammaproteobacteria bacterium]
MNKISKVLLGTFASFALAVPFFVSAQEVEEVVVTATKKAESIQDLALSIEAFTAEDMEKNLIKDASDLQEVVPGLIADKGIGSGVSYAIRGTGSYGVGAAVVGAVVTSMNGHSVGTGAFYDLGFYDVERIEVLKGPQGTLFGRNAVNGVINVISARPTSEFEGKVDITYGDYSQEELTAVINVPISDTIRSRLAVTSSKRDGFTQNVRDGSYFNNKDAMGARLSIDFDIGESSTLKFTHDWSQGSDNRNNIGAPFCESHDLYGCNPLTVGGPNQPAASMGSTAAIFNLVGGLEASSFVNQYAGTIVPDNFRKAYLTRNPEFDSEHTFTQIEFETELTSELMLSARVSHVSRDYFHMNDNDYSHTTKPFPGVLGAAMGLPPISWQGTFGGTFNGDDYSFTELVDSDRTYEFSNAEDNGIQAEITIISDYDGPFNFVTGLYSYDNRSHNRYQVQTAAWNMTGNFSNHLYSSLVYGGQFDAYGGIPFYQTLILGGLSGSDACASGALGPVAAASPSTANPACLSGLLAAQGINPYHVPTELAGYLNDDHVRTKSMALFGELYFDLSDVTKLTVGYRFNDDTVKDTIMTCLADFDCPNYPQSQYESGEYGFHPTSIVVADDAFAYKVAIQHDLSDNQMVYASYTTATKAGGNNPVIGTEPDPYDPEETGVFEIGTKSILMDGAVLFNASFFMNDTKGMLISNIEDAGSVNYNVDAEIKGFEGNMIAFLSETSSIDISWLLVDSELGDQSMPDPLNPAGIIALLDVDPTAWTPGVDGCATGIGLCTPTAFGAGVQALPYDAAGAVTYGWAVGADGNPVAIFKSAGSICAGPFSPLTGVPCSVPPLQVSLGGNSLPQSPESSYSIGFNNDFVRENGVTSVRLAYRYQAEREGNVFNQDRARMPETKYWDVSATYTPDNADWYVKAYIKNIADDQFVGSWAASSALQGGAQFATYTDPRLWGVSFGTTF